MKQLLNIPIIKIRANRYQPRVQFNDKSLSELADSIKENGIIQPITVREYGDDEYEIIAGERRYRAAMIAKKKEIPCYIIDASEQNARQSALVENIQRENLTPIEEAVAYVQIMKHSSITQSELSKKVGKSQSTIANKIRLLNLPIEVKNGLSQRIITERHARSLLSLPSDKMVDAYNFIVKKGYNVLQTVGYVEEKLNESPKKNKRVTKGRSKNAQIGINSVNECVAKIKQAGINVTSELVDDTDGVKIIIKFPN
ncbi:MAG: ParB/RepB/Spo0J family partition protein [Anaerorhabdus sp.]